MAIQTWEEARELLEKYRSYIIAVARYVAYKIAEAQGTVDSRQVRELLVEGGLMPRGDERWMGCVFSQRTLFEYTGKKRAVEEASPRTRGGGGGGRDIRIWKIAKDAIPPEAPEFWEGGQIEGFPEALEPERADFAVQEIRRRFQHSLVAREYRAAALRGDQQAMNRLWDEMAGIENTLAGESGEVEVQDFLLWALWKLSNVPRRRP